MALGNLLDYAYEYAHSRIYRYEFGYKSRLMPLA